MFSAAKTVVQPEVATLHDSEGQTSETCRFGRESAARSCKPCRRATALFLFSILAVAQTDAWAQEPAFKLTRFDEDYRFLSDAEKRTTLEDEIKYLDLGAGVHLSLGGEWRERVDNLDAAKFGIGTRSDTYDLERLMLHADLSLGSRARVFAQLARDDAYDKTRPYGSNDVDRADLQNAFIDLLPFDDARFTLRAGRQEMLFSATQRFVSVREGPNVRQSFDGVRALLKDGSLHLDLFATRPVADRPGAFDDSPDQTQVFYGAYGSAALSPDQTLDLYLLGLNRDRVTFGSQTGNERRLSLGVRSASTAKPFDHDVDIVTQFGTFDGKDIRAWAIGATAGYTWPLEWAPRAGLELDAGSGNRSPGGRRLETFNPLFPSGTYFNESALTSWANLVLLRARLTIQPMRTLKLSASISERWRQSARDAVYLQPYTPLAATLANGERRVGMGAQLDATWRMNRYFSASLEYLHQEAGPAIRLARGRPVDFAMAIGQLRF